MKKINTSVIRKIVSLFTVLLAVVIFITSCSKKPTPTPAKKSNTELLTAHDWIEVKVEFGSSQNDLTEKPFNDAFHASGIRFTSTTNDNGTFIADIENGTWELINSETELQINIAKDDSQGINAQTIVLSITFTTDGKLVFLFPNGRYGYGTTDGTVYTYAVMRETFQ